MAKPNLFIVGAPKCGTTAWAHYLSSHPEIFFSKVKEPHYFSTDFPNFCWAKSMEQYLRYFEGSDNFKVVAEASVCYLYSTEAAQSIFSFNPSSKILIFLRDQTSFLPSYHNQLIFNQDESIEDFETVWNMSVNSKRAKYPEKCRSQAFLDYARVGMFSEQVKRYTDLFPPEQLLVVHYDRWTADPKSSHKKILNFLNVEDDGRVDFEVIHAAQSHRFGTVKRLTQMPSENLIKISRFVKQTLGLKRLNLASRIRKLNSKQGYKKPMDPELRAAIKGFFHEDNLRLEKLLKQYNRNHKT